MVHPRCPNCKKIYRLMVSDDHTYNWMMKHGSSTCPHQFTSYADLEEQCVKDVREYFKQEFPWKYEDARKALS